jgi:site-specific DNA recombinase
MSTQVAIYTRISQDPSGEQTATRRQESACRSYAAARGWDVERVFEDVDVSAYSGIERPAYEEMLEGLSSGVVEGVLVWKLDRLVRRTAEFERFWAVCEAAGARLASVTEALDSSTEIGLAIIRVLVTFATLESATKGERMRAKFEEMARAGKPGRINHRVFGLDRTWTNVIPEEAALVREAAQRMIAGEGLTDVCRDWNRRGLSTPTGNPWSSSALGQLLYNPRLVGDRRHRGEVVARGTWPAILERETFEALLAAKVSRRHVLPHRRNYLLTGLLVCGRCGGRVGGSRRTDNRSTIYRCRPFPYGCAGTAAKASTLEGWVAERTFAYLDGARLRRRIDAELARVAPDDIPRISEIRDQLRRLAEDHYRRNVIDGTQYLSLQRTLAERLERADAAPARRTEFPFLARWAGRGHELRRDWSALEPDHRRRALSAAIRKIDMGPGKPGSPHFQPGRFKIRWTL